MLNETRKKVDSFQILANLNNYNNNPPRVIRERRSEIVERKDNIFFGNEELIETNSKSPKSRKNKRNMSIFKENENKLEEKLKNFDKQYDGNLFF